jgi:hypothetical protein
VRWPQYLLLVYNTLPDSNQTSPKSPKMRQMLRD